MKRRFNSLILSKFKRKGSIFASYPRKKVYSSSHIQKKRVQFFESWKKARFNFCDSCWKEGFDSVVTWKNGSVLWVMFFFKKSSTLRVICKKKFQFFEFCESCSKKKFISLTHVGKVGLIRWLYWKRGFSALSHTFKSSILWFIFSKGSILESQIFEEGQVFESYWKKKQGSILWVNLQKGSIHWDIFKKEGSIHRVILKKKKKKKQFFESLWEKCSILWVTFKKEGSILRVKLKKGSILWVIFSKNDQFILWVIHCVKKKYSLSQTKKETFSLSHVEKKCSIFDPIRWVILKKVQKDWILRMNHICEKGLVVRAFKKSSILREIFLFTKIKSLGQYFQRKDHCSLSRICEKKFSLSHAKKGVIFFDSRRKEGFNLNESYS